jgi:hypothetical protein
MRTTVDLSDDLYRRVKAEAALRGRKFKELVEEGLRQVLVAAEAGETAKQQPGPSLHDLMRDCCGVAAGAPTDYATNPEYMKESGR